MPVTVRQIKLVRETWEKVLPIADTAAQLFYNRLFEIDPELRSLFHGDMNEQGHKLMAMIGLAVASLNDLEKIMPRIRELGERHTSYGVKDKDYDTVAGALLWTLEQGLQDAFTPEVKEAWTAVYIVLATTMIAAANQKAAA